MTEPRPPRSRRLARLVCGLSRRAILVLATIAATVLITWAWLSRSLPDLQTWHRFTPASEFRHDDPQRPRTFDAYLAAEARVFKERDGAFIEPTPGHSRFIRYVSGGPADPRRLEHDWNRTQILLPVGEPRGAALLLHGLTDSPYSMRATAEILRAKGFKVVILRFPHHGTTPAALLDADWRDWDEAARLALDAISEEFPPGRPLLVGGYSTGGAIAVLRTLAALETPGARAPDAVLLYSPAVGITPFARASNIHKLLSWVPAFEKHRWMDVEVEFDPWKYASFPRNGGAQSWAVCVALREAMARASASGALERFPRLLTFQSVVDATVLSRDVVERFHRSIAAPGSELVVFNVSSQGYLADFIDHSWSPAVQALQADSSLPFRLTLVTSESPDSAAVIELSKAPFTTTSASRPLGLAWPDGVFSLSHVAIPFPPDDAWYGDGGAGGARTLGNLAPRGEKNVLRVSPAFLLRLRHNPFWPYMRERIEGLADELLSGEPPAPRPARSPSTTSAATSPRSWRASSRWRPSSGRSCPSPRSKPAHAPGSSAARRRRHPSSPGSGASRPTGAPPPKKDPEKNAA